MTLLSRRSWLRRIGAAMVAAPLAARLPLRRRRPRVETWCRVDGTPVSPELAELNRVTMTAIMPGLVDDVFRNGPLMNHLRRRG